MSIEKTKKILNNYLASSMIFLIAQELLITFTYYAKINRNINTFDSHFLYFVSPILSAFLIICSFFIMKKYYHPSNEHYLLHSILWAFLFLPQMIPLFIYDLNIIYTSWTFILTTTTLAVIMFQDFVIIGLNNLSQNGNNFVYDELKFILDKISVGWLTLGSILAIAMTILWTAPISSFTMSYTERVFWAVYMVLCFITVTILLIIFLIIPTFKSIRQVRDSFISHENNVA